MDPRYTFEEFVVGPHNRFPQAAAQAVADNLGKAYNPLFIYGPVGLGKTHLMHAIGHRVLIKNAQSKILYITAEQFMTEVIEVLRAGALDQMRERYRNLDLLLVDDIQFLSASEATQEEFFHIFNLLHQNGKQIVMTSDRPPKMLTTLEDRLRSRFEWGLTADIKIPNLETRMAILKQKESQFQGVNLVENIRLYIAGKLKSNVRELEGFLRRIQAYAQLNNREINLALVKEIMRDLLPPNEWDEEDKPAAAPAPLSPPQASSLTSDTDSMVKRVAADINQLLPGASPPAKPSPAEERPILMPPKAAAVNPPAPSAEYPPEHRVTPAVSPSAVNLDKVSGSLPPLSAGKSMPVPPLSTLEGGSKSIPVAFFYPEGNDRELTQVRRKFDDVIRKHKLKFQLEAACTAAYVPSDGMSYDAFVYQCKQKKLHIAIVLGPPPESGLANYEFQQKLLEICELERVSLQMIPWDEINKDYKYLNLALDITLIRFNKDK